MAGIDLAVPPWQFRSSISALAAFGWRGNASPSAEDIKYWYFMRLTDREGVGLNLHWHFLCDIYNDQADAFFWSSAIPLDCGGVRTLQLDPTAMLLHVILHGIGRTGEATSRWISDALAILQHEGGRVDWERMIAFAQSQRLTYRLALALEHVAERHDAPVPREVLTRLRRIRTSLLERIEKTVIFDHDRQRFETNPVAKQWIIFIDFCRCAAAAGPIEFVVGLSHYIRYRWRLGRRRELIGAVLRGLTRRIGRAWL
jgi:hypothetical protein